MKPMEAWSIVAPIIAAHAEGAGYYGKLNPIDEAYVTVYGALQYLDTNEVCTSPERCVYRRKRGNETDSCRNDYRRSGGTGSA